MAFTITLAALLEQTSEPRVNLPSLLKRFDDSGIRATLAQDRGFLPPAFYSAARQLQHRFQARIVPLLPSLKNIRDNVVAHHGVETDWPHATYGLLNMIMFRTVALVDGINHLALGLTTSIRLTMATARYQTAALLDAGIDGAADLDIGLPREE